MAINSAAARRMPSGAMPITVGLTCALAFLTILFSIPVTDVLLRQVFAVAVLLTLAPTILAILAAAVQGRPRLHRICIYAAVAALSGILGFVGGDLESGIKNDMSGLVARSECLDRTFPEAMEAHSKFNAAYSAAMYCYDEKR